MIRLAAAPQSSSYIHVDAECLAQLGAGLVAMGMWGTTNKFVQTGASFLRPLDAGIVNRTECRVLSNHAVCQVSFRAA